MLELGHMNRLEVHKIDADGAWLGDAREAALLSRREFDETVVPGALLNVFVYADTSGQPVATLRQPKAEVGQFALMRVCQVNAHGAFMDWGLAKDLLVPVKEQPETMKVGQSYLVGVRLDREGRPIGTGRIEKCLFRVDDSLKPGQVVELIAWQFTDLGVKVIIDNRFAGLLYRNETGAHLKYGDRLKGYVRQVRSDGKVDCTLSMGRKEDRTEAKEKIMQALIDSQGFLPLHDKSSPDQIQNELGMSKKLFKKGVGALYKADLVELTGDGIKLKE